MIHNTSKEPSLFSYLCFVLLLFLSSCLNNLEKELSKTNSLWYVYDYDESKDSFAIRYYGYKFYPNGSMIPFYYDPIDDNKYELEFDDVAFSKKWYYSEEKHLLHYLDIENIVLSYDIDTLLLKNHKTGELYLLVNIGTEAQPNTIADSIVSVSRFNAVL